MLFFANRFSGNRDESRDWRKGIASVAVEEGYLELESRLAIVNFSAHNLEISEARHFQSTPGDDEKEIENITTILFVVVAREHSQLNHSWGCNIQIPGMWRIFYTFGGHSPVIEVEPYQFAMVH